jgi:hypothetical protein
METSNLPPNTPRRLRLLLLTVTLLTAVTIAANGPIASSSFVGAENPLSENGTWVAVTAYSPYGTVFQKNNGAFLDRLSPLNHGAAHTTAVVPDDQYSEIVVGHVNDTRNNVGAIVRVQTGGANVDSVYLWWASLAGGQNALFRLDAHIPDLSRPTTYTATPLIPSSPVVDGDRLRLVARGNVLYGLKNGVRDFIYNTGTNLIRYGAGSTGIMAYADGAVNNAIITSWSTGAAPVSSGTWAATTFAGTENPLDESDRWYPLPGYLGFRKAGGEVIGLSSNHNAAGAWSIAPPQKQYSEVTLNAVTSGGGGPIVRIDRNNPGQTGWLLFLDVGSPGSSGIYKMTPDGNFTAAQFFTPAIVQGDKWRLTADGNVLEVFRNGVSQFTYTTDGSYPGGDVGIEAFTTAFTFSAWEGGDLAGAAPADTQPPTAPTNLTAAAAGTSQIDLAWSGSTDNVGVTAYLVERCAGAGCSAFTQVASVSGTSFSDTALAAGTSYSYQVRATDAAGNRSQYSNVASATTGSAAQVVLTAKKVSRAGVGDGTITSTSNPSSPNQVNCGAGCAEVAVSFDYDTVVTLTAVPNAVSTFSHWSGCDSVSGNVCTVRMTFSRSATANFLP